MKGNRNAVMTTIFDTPLHSCIVFPWSVGGNGSGTSGRNVTGNLLAMDGVVVILELRDIDSTLIPRASVRSDPSYEEWTLRLDTEAATAQCH